MSNFIRNIIAYACLTLEQIFSLFQNISSLFIEVKSSQPFCLHISESQNTNNDQPVLEETHKHVIVCIEEICKRLSLHSQEMVTNNLLYGLVHQNDCNPSAVPEYEERLIDAMCAQTQCLGKLISDHMVVVSHTLSLPLFCQLNCANYKLNSLNLSPEIKEVANNKVKGVLEESPVTWFIQASVMFVDEDPAFWDSLSMESKFQTGEIDSAGTTKEIGKGTRKRGQGSQKDYIADIIDDRNSSDQREEFKGEIEGKSERRRKETETCKVFIINKDCACGQLSSTTAQALKGVRWDKFGLKLENCITMSRTVNTGNSNLNQAVSFPTKSAKKKYDGFNGIKQIFNLPDDSQSITDNAKEMNPLGVVPSFNNACTSNPIHASEIEEPDCAAELFLSEIQDNSSPFDATHSWKMRLLILAFGMEVETQKSAIADLDDFIQQAPSSINESEISPFDWDKDDEYVTESPHPYPFLFKGSLQDPHQVISPRVNAPFEKDEKKHRKKQEKTSLANKKNGSTEINQYEPIPIPSSLLTFNTTLGTKDDIYSRDPSGTNKPLSSASSIVPELLRQWRRLTEGRLDPKAELHHVRGAVEGALWKAKLRIGREYGSTAMMSKTEQRLSTVVPSLAASVSTILRNAQNPNLVSYALRMMEAENCESDTSQFQNFIHAKLLQVMQDSMSMGSVLKEGLLHQSMTRRRQEELMRKRSGGGKKEAKRWRDDREDEGRTTSLQMDEQLQESREGAKRWDDRGIGREKGSFKRREEEEEKEEEEEEEKGDEEDEEADEEEGEEREVEEDEENGRKIYDDFFVD